MLSIVILTKNEESDLPNCLKSIEWCDDIYVLDSGSSDSTLEIANIRNVITITNPFKSFGQQRNFALDNINFKYDWILFLDADERVTIGFYTAIINAIKVADESIAGFYCCCKMILEDVWLKRCDNFPKWQFRLMQKGKARFTDFGHGQKEADVNGTLAYIKEPYLHYGFSKGWTLWLDRHNRYSILEANERLTSNLGFRNIFSKHNSIRNQALKVWLSSIPGWPLLRFLFSYVFKLGFLEGVPGFIYCVNMGYYEFLIKIKMRELRDRKVINR